MATIRALGTSGTLNKASNEENEHAAGGSFRLKELEKENRNLQAELKKVKQHLIHAERDASEAQEKLTLVDGKLRERTREKISLENQYTALRSHLSEQDFQLFTAKQISERAQKMRLKHEKDSAEVQLRLEERKAVRVRQDMAYEELQEMVARMAAERSALEQSHAEELRAKEDENNAVVAGYKLQVRDLSVKIDEVMEKVTALEQGAVDNKDLAARLREETLMHRDAKLQAEDALRKKGHEIDELNHEVARLVDEHEELEGRAAEARLRILDLTEQLQAAEGKSEETAALQADVAALQAKCSEYEGRLAEVEGQLARANEAKEALEKQVASLREEHARVMAAQVALASEAAAAMAARHKQLERERDEALATQRAAVEMASATEKSVQEQLAQTAVALEASMVRCENIARAVREKQDRVEELEKQLTDTRTKAETERAEFSKGIQEYQAIALNVQREVDGMTKAMVEERDALAAKCTALIAALESTRQQLQEAERASQLASRHHEERLSDMAAALRAKDDALAATNVIIEQRAQDAETARAALAHWESQYRALQKSCEKSETREREARVAMIAMEETVAVVEELHQQVTESQHVLTRTKEEADTHRVRAAALEAEVGSLRATLGAVQAECIVAKEESARLQSVCNRAASTASTMEAAASAEKAKAAAVQCEYDLLRGEVARLERLSERLAEEKEQLGHDLAAAHAEREAIPKDLQEQNARLTHEVAVLRAELADYQEREARLAESNAKLAGHANPRQKIHYVEQLKNENQDLRKQLQILMEKWTPNAPATPSH